MDSNREYIKLKSTIISRYYSHLIVLAIGFVLGVISLPEGEESVKIEYVTEKVPFKDLVLIDIPKPIFITDTIINEVRYPVNTFEGIQKTEYGDLKYKASTAGYLLDLEFNPNFMIPVQNKVITKTIERPSLYANISYNSMRSLSVGLTFVHKKWEIGYARGLDNSNTIRLGRRIF